MSKPKISVIIPAYNAENYIEESIKSILNQTFSDFELLILDDASTDNTYSKAANFKDSRIRLERNDKNLYIAANRNKGISLANGKYIVWQDADDISYLNRLEEQYSFMEKQPEVGICGSYLEIFDHKGTSHIRKYETTDEKVRSTIFRYSPVAQPSAIIRKECFDKVGSYNLDMPPAEDIEMSFRIGQHYKFANIPKPLIRYRVHRQSATYAKLKLIEDNTMKVRRDFVSNPAYRFTLYDEVYNFLQKASLELMPSEFRITLFNFMRRSKLI